MALAVEHETLGGLELALAHQGYFHLILDVFHAHAVAEGKVSENLLQDFGIDGFVD